MWNLRFREFGRRQIIAPPSASSLLLLERGQSAYGLRFKVFIVPDDTDTAPGVIDDYRAEAISNVFSFVS
jgi:hypothetical protein